MKAPHGNSDDSCGTRVTDPSGVDGICGLVDRWIRVCGYCLHALQSNLEKYAQTLQGKFCATCYCFVCSEKQYCLNSVIQWSYLKKYLMKLTLYFKIKIIFILFFKLN